MTWERTLAITIQTLSMGRERQKRIQILQIESSKNSNTSPMCRRTSARVGVCPSRHRICRILVTTTTTSSSSSTSGSGSSIRRKASGLGRLTHKSLLPRRSQSNVCISLEMVKRLKKSHSNLRYEREESEIAESAKKTLRDGKSNE